MKKTILIILFLFFRNQLFCQTQNLNISQNVINLFESADSIALTYIENKGLQKINTKAEIKYLIKRYYMAVSKSPVDFQRYLDIENKKWGEDFKNGNTSALKPAFKIHLIKKMISELKGEYYTQSISVPYYLKVKILKIRHGQYISFSPSNYTVHKTILLAQIEDIVKGEERFKGLDTININIINQWMKNTGEFFHEGYQYFVPLRPFNCRNGNCEGIALDVLPDKSSSIYPIVNNDVEIKDNYFQLGSSLNWTEFKKLFTEKFIIK